MSYAEVSDLEARLGRTLDTAEKERAEVLLSDASVYLDALVSPSDVCVMAETLKIVCCNIVSRAMATTSSDMFGVKQATISADIYSQTLSYQNPSGDFYMTKADKKMLGISDGYIGSIRPKIGYRHD